MAHNGTTESWMKLKWSRPKSFYFVKSMRGWYWHEKNSWCVAFDFAAIKQSTKYLAFHTLRFFKLRPFKPVLCYLSNIYQPSECSKRDKIFLFFRNTNGIIQMREFWNAMNKFGELIYSQNLISFKKTSLRIYQQYAVLGTKNKDISYQFFLWNRFCSLYVVNIDTKGSKKKFQHFKCLLDLPSSTLHWRSKSSCLAGPPLKLNLCTCIIFFIKTI